MYYTVKKLKLKYEEKKNRQKGKDSAKLMTGSEKKYS